MNQNFESSGQKENKEYWSRGCQKFWLWPFVFETRLYFVASVLAMAIQFDVMQVNSLCWAGVCNAGCWLAQSWQYMLPQLGSAMLDVYRAIRGLPAEQQAQILV